MNRIRPTALLCSLEILDEDGNLERKADMFTKRTINQQVTIDHVDTASEALAVSIGERARVDLDYMASLLGTPGETDSIIRDLKGVIYKNPEAGGGPLNGWETADEYLSGNVRKKLAAARAAAENDPILRKMWPHWNRRSQKTSPLRRLMCGSALPGLTRSIIPNSSMNS